MQKKKTGSGSIFSEPNLSRIAIQLLKMKFDMPLKAKNAGFKEKCAY